MSAAWLRVCSHIFLICTGFSNADVIMLVLICPDFNLSIDFIPQGISKPENFPNLKNLVISSCEIKTLSSKDIEGLKDLTNFELQRTNVKHVPGDFFNSNVKVQRIIFENNQIESFGKGFLDGLDLKTVTIVEKCINANFANTEIEEIKRRLEENCPEVESSRGGEKSSTGPEKSSTLSECDQEHFIIKIVNQGNLTLNLYQYENETELFSVVDVSNPTY